MPLAVRLGSHGLISVIPVSVWYTIFLWHLRHPTITLLEYFPSHSATLRWHCGQYIVYLFDFVFFFIKPSFHAKSTIAKCNSASSKEILSYQKTLSVLSIIIITLKKRTYRTTFIFRHISYKLFSRCLQCYRHQYGLLLGSKTYFQET